MPGCAFCSEEVVWATSEYTGKPIPLNKEPVAGGNVTGEWRDGKLLVHVMSYRERELAVAQEPQRKFFIEHHATCVGRHRVKAGEHVGQQSLAI